jgi:hypothetical protein
MPEVVAVVGGGGRVHDLHVSAENIRVARINIGNISFHCVDPGSKVVHYTCGIDLKGAQFMSANNWRSFLT